MLFSVQRKEPSITLGYKGTFPFRWPHTLTGKQLHLHEHVQGISGGGKSYYLIKKYTDLVMQGVGAALIDPHGDLAHDCLRVLYERGFFNRPDCFDKLWYVDFTHPSAFVPFNILNQPYQPYTIGRHIAKALKRAYSANLAGEGAAPVFTDMAQFSAIVLIYNGLPITKATQLLTDPAFRERLLAIVPHQQTHEFFHLRFDRWDARDRTQKVESFLNKLSDLTVTDPMYLALSHTENILNMKQHIRDGRSLIFNIHMDDDESKRLLGCLLVVAFEEAALTRPEYARSLYHLIIDEFASFCTHDGKTEQELLSQARKYQFILTLAHQTWDQLSDSMKTAMGNAWIETYFGLCYEDAQVVAPQIGHYEPQKEKHVVTDENQQDRSHPLFYSMPEQWEFISRNLENLHPQQAYVKIKRVLPWWKQHFMQPFNVFKMRTATIPQQKCSNEQIAAVKDCYAKKLLRTRAEIEATPFANQILDQRVALADDEVEIPHSRWVDVK